MFRHQADVRLLLQSLLTVTSGRTGVKVPTRKSTGRMAAATALSSLKKKRRAPKAPEQGAGLPSAMFTHTDLVPLSDQAEGSNLFAGGAEAPAKRNRPEPNTTKRKAKADFKAAQISAAGLALTDSEGQADWLRAQHAVHNKSSFLEHEEMKGNGLMDRMMTSE